MGRLIKDMIFFLFKEASSADKLMYIFLYNIIAKHAL